MQCHLHRQVVSANGTKQHAAPQTDIHYPDVAGRSGMLETWWVNESTGLGWGLSSFVHGNE